MLDLSQNQLDGLIKINRKLVLRGLDPQLWLIEQWPLNLEQLHVKFEQENSDTKDKERCLHHAL